MTKAKATTTSMILDAAQTVTVMLAGAHRHACEAASARGRAAAAGSQPRQPSTGVFSDF